MPRAGLQVQLHLRRPRSANSQVMLKPTSRRPGRSGTPPMSGSYLNRRRPGWPGRGHHLVQGARHAVVQEDRRAIPDAAQRERGEVPLHLLGAAERPTAPDPGAVR